MSTSSLVFTSSTGAVSIAFDAAAMPVDVVAENPWGIVCCLGQDGITSTSSCNRIALASTGAWCPWCHPGFPESEWER